MNSLAQIVLPVRKLARVFPRRTKASPDDDLAFFRPPELFDEAVCCPLHDPQGARD